MLARQNVPDLNDRRIERDDPGRLTRMPAEQANPRTGDVEVIAWPDADASRGGNGLLCKRERRRERHERRQLGRVLQRVWRVGARKMAHHQNRGERRKTEGQPRKLCRLDAEPVHAGVELEARGVGGQLVPPAFHLRRAVQKRDERCLLQKRCIAVHEPGEDEYVRPGPQNPPESRTFLGERHEEAARPGLHENGRHLGEAKSVSIGLHHGRRLRLSGRVGQRPPVGGDCS